MKKYHVFQDVSIAYFLICLISLTAQCGLTLYLYKIELDNFLHDDDQLLCYAVAFRSQHCSILPYFPILTSFLQLRG